MKEMKYFIPPTEKQFLYHLIISQLYHDGFTELGVKLENVALGNTGDIVPGNRLSEILSSCLLSVREVSSYLDRIGGTVKINSLNADSDPGRRDTPSPLSRKRLHSGPAVVSHGGISSTLSCAKDAVPSCEGAAPTPGTVTPRKAATTAAAAAHPPPHPPPESPVNIVTNFTSPSFIEEEPSKLSKELEEICRAVQGGDNLVIGLNNSDKSSDSNVKVETTSVTQQTIFSPSSSTESSIIDETAEKLINNLTNITNLGSDDIAELTATLVESLVQDSVNCNKASEISKSLAKSSENITPSGPATNTISDEVYNDKIITTLYSSGVSELEHTPQIDKEAIKDPVKYYQQQAIGVNMPFNNSRYKPFRRHRTRFKDDQIAILEHFYNNVSKYARPDKGLRELIDSTGLHHDTIMLWFQNKRAREKRKGWDEKDSGIGGGTTSNAKVNNKKAKVEVL